ncbi:MAG: peroxiredoxin [Thaumarchaeota archaeon]|jgi:peroxiredoxin family protein|nr:peroxiredoxin [Nitrososphaerota archaeon]
MSDKLAIVVFSGTVDRLLPAAIIASGGVAMGMDVELFLTFWGLNAFRKDSVNSNTRFSKDYEDMAPVMMQIMKNKNVPSWFEMLKKAKEIGNVKVHACAMTYDLLDMKKEDLAEIVDDVIGVGEFINIAKDAKITLFI